LLQLYVFLLIKIYLNLNQSANLFLLVFITLLVYVALKFILLPLSYPCDPNSSPSSPLSIFTCFTYLTCLHL